MNKGKAYWFALLSEADTERKLNRIIEEAALDESLTNAEYCEVYSYGLDLLRKM